MSIVPSMSGFRSAPRVDGGSGAAELEMMYTLGSTLEVDDVLRAISHNIVDVTGSQACGFCIVDQETDLHITSWWEPGVLAYPSWELAQLLNRPEWCRTTRGIMAVLDHETCMVVSDTQPSPAGGLNVARHLGFKSGLYVPCMMGDRLRAVAAAVSFGDYHDFTEEHIHAVEGIAQAAGPAIASALLHEQSKRMAVAEERSRLAREIHDSLAQSLGYFGLRLSMAEQLIDERDLDGAREFVREVRSLAQESYREAREAILDLRTASQEGVGLPSSLRRHVAAFQSLGDLDVSLHIDDAIDDSTCRPATTMQVIRVVQEALGNVRKHAAATSVTVRLEIEGGWLCARVRDDGRGFDTAPYEDVSNVCHYGLQAMRERAAGVGGRLSVTSVLGAGSEVLLLVPVDVAGARSA